MGLNIRSCQKFSYFSARINISHGSTSKKEEKYSVFECKKEEKKKIIQFLNGELFAHKYTGKIFIICWKIKVELNLVSIEGSKS